VPRPLQDHDALRWLAQDRPAVAEVMRRLAALSCDAAW